MYLIVSLQEARLPKTIRRQLDRLFFFFGEEPFYDYYREVHRVRRKLEKRSFFYSSIEIKQLSDK